MNATLSSVQAITAYEKTVAFQAHCSHEEWEHDRSLIARTQESKERVLRENRDLLDRKDTWKWAASAIGYLQGCATLAASYPVMGTRAGKVLALSGTAEITNQLLSDLYGWEGAPWVHASLSLLSLGAGFSALGSDKTKEALSYIQNASLLAKGGVSIANTVTEGQLAALQVKLKSYNLDQEKLSLESREEVEGLNQVCRSLSAMMQEVTRRIKDAYLKV
ncbi:MAG: hypothetical protein KGI80_06525 [Verrucomicrobiota bacterium]|nr:hypothetical protein [Verrucomicrobiota bacterium]